MLHFIYALRQYDYQLPRSVLYLISWFIIIICCTSLISQCIDLFFELAEDTEKYNKFYEQFGKNIKLGIHEDSANRAKLAKLLRFHSTKSGETQVSLDDYLGRMQNEQDVIYYVTGM